MIEERFLLFSAAGEGFALNLREVCEVMEPQESFPVPGAPRHFVGLINFHGTLTALVDLGLYLGSEQPASQGNVLVLDAKLAQLALSVDGVRAIVNREAITDLEPGEDPLTAAVIDSAYGRCRVLLLETLVSGLEEGLTLLAPERRQ